RIRRPQEQPALFDLDGSLRRLAAKPKPARYEDKMNPAHVLPLPCCHRWTHPRPAAEQHKMGAQLCAKHPPQHLENLRRCWCVPAAQSREVAVAGLRHSCVPGAVLGGPRRHRRNETLTLIFLIVSLLTLPPAHLSFAAE